MWDTNNIYLKNIGNMCYFIKYKMRWVPILKLDIKKTCTCFKNTSDATVF